MSRKGGSGGAQQTGSVPVLAAKRGKELEAGLRSRVEKSSFVFLTFLGNRENLSKITDSVCNGR